MPIRNCPFTYCGGDFYRPILNIKLINPDTNDTYRTYGIIDTGADKCSVPADFAPILKHDLEAGDIVQIDTASGESEAYSHTTEIELYHPTTDKHLYTISTTKVDYIPGLKTVLLGADDFLSSFILKIDYPHRIFSIKSP